MTTPKNTTPATTPTLAEAMRKVAAIRDELGARFLEASDRVDAILVALVARQHVVMLGPAGEAKSAVTDAIRSRVQGARGFKQLLTRTTSPDELFGAFDPGAFKAGRYHRLTAGMLPDAEVAFLDECFKAGSFLLNALLGLMNEREFSNCGVIERSPLVTLIGASNEGPADDGEQSLAALWDRFTLRLVVKPLSRGSRRQFVSDELTRRAVEATGADTTGRAGTVLSLAELTLLQEAALRVTIPARVRDLYWDIEERLEAVGLPLPSTRRLGWLWGLVAASAVLAGRTEANPEDLLILRHALWDDAEQIPAVASAVYGAAVPTLAQAQADYDAIVEDVAKLRVNLAAHSAANEESYRVAVRATVLAKLKSAMTTMRTYLDTATAAGQVNTARAIQSLGKDLRAMREELTAAAKSEDADWG